MSRPDEVLHGPPQSGFWFGPDDLQTSRPTSTAPCPEAVWGFSGALEGDDVTYPPPPGEGACSPVKGSTSVDFVLPRRPVSSLGSVLLNLREGSRLEGLCRVAPLLCLPNVLVLNELL